MTGAMLTYKWSMTRNRSAARFTLTFIEKQGILEKNAYFLGEAD